MELFINDFGEFKMGIFPHKEVSCAICKHESYVPSKNGTIVYLNTNPDLQIVQNRIEQNAGKVLLSKTNFGRTWLYVFIFSY